MARRRNSIMSDSLKYRLVQEMGYGDIAQREGFGALPSRVNGMMVKQAIEFAERNLGNR
jgi:small acid-soluble spore protein F (minor alpha/beta-type SASP)